MFVDELPRMGSLGGLAETLAAMLALALRSQLTRTELDADPARLLALLWILEAWGRCRGSLACTPGMPVGSGLLHALTRSCSAPALQPVQSQGRQLPASLLGLHRAAVAHAVLCVVAAAAGVLPA